MPFVSRTAIGETADIDARPHLHNTGDKQPALTTVIPAKAGIHAAAGPNLGWSRIRSPVPPLQGNDERG